MFTAALPYFSAAPVRPRPLCATVVRPESRLMRRLTDRLTLITLLLLAFAVAVATEGLIPGERWLSGIAVAGLAATRGMAQRPPWAILRGLSA